MAPEPAFSGPAAPQAGGSRRDVRLDFFRGLAMFVIFIAHLPGNSWFDFIPARFGFSSAAELFVFCSGLASAFAFGRVFTREGWRAGTRRILHRIWQVYWAHIGLALALMALSVAALRLTGIDYPGRLGLDWFLSHAGEGLLALMTLGFMPAFLDILPMYLVLLAMVPLVMGAAALTPLLPLALLPALWLSVQIYGFNLPGGPAPGGVWFFNPFAWQLVFFSGFAFGMGWLPRPALRRGGLFWCCVALLVLSVPVNFWAFTDAFPTLAAIHDRFVPEGGKTDLAPALYLHFLASAYVVLTLVEPVRARLATIRPVVLVGQQALATFMASILLAWAGGMLLDALGRAQGVIALVNLAGFAGLVLVAVLARDYKGGGKPGSAPRSRPEAASNGGDAVPRATPAE
ncbi:MAG: OpgC domain-containing protein [Hyphomicrobiales bacterium]|nr:OpgC domain-containing protein [Hyphomicrobiales bacterium]